MTTTKTTLRLIEKIAKIKQEIGVMSKDLTNPFFKSKYLDINQLLENIKPLEEKYRVSITQPLTHVGEKPAIALVIDDLDSDPNFEKEKDMQIREVTVLPENTDPQKIGSIITYFRRYALVSYFEIQAEDDDGNHGASKTVVSAPKVSTTGQIKPNNSMLNAKQKAQKAIEDTKTLEELEKVSEHIKISQILSSKEKESLMSEVDNKAMDFE